MAALQARSLKAQEAASTPKEKSALAKGTYIVPQHQLWPEIARALPNELVRSALFNAKNRTDKRADFKDQPIAVIGGGKINYRGEELRQDDQTVWLQLIHLARSQPLGEIVEFTPNAFCSAIGWGTGGKDFERLRKCLSRMQATALSIHSERLGRGVSLSMIPVFSWKNEATGTALKSYQVTAAPDLVKLFCDLQYTQLEWAQRLALPGGLATWLHGYLASHREPFAIKLETIRKGAGVTSEGRKLKQLVKRALDNLVEVGFLQAWSFEDDLVLCTRTK